MRGMDGKNTEMRASDRPLTPQSTPIRILFAMATPRPSTHVDFAITSALPYHAVTPSQLTYISIIVVQLQ